MLERDKRTQQNMTKWSSFQAVPKTLETVTGLCLSNEKLKKLLYYSDKHALGMPNLTPEQSLSLLGKQIRIVPKLEVEPDAKPYIIISLDNFVPMPSQTTFKTVTLSIDILCAYDYWLLDDFVLRPYAIAGELDGMINNSTLVNKGVADFVGAKQLVLNEYLGGCSLYYKIETFYDDYESQKPSIDKVGRATNLFG